MKNVQQFAKRFAVNAVVLFAICAVLYFAFPNQIKPAWDLLYSLFGPAVLLLLLLVAAIPGRRRKG